jgi:hypothetical protein
MFHFADRLDIGLTAALEEPGGDPLFDTIVQALGEFALHTREYGINAKNSDIFHRFGIGRFLMVHWNKTTVGLMFFHEALQRPGFLGRVIHQRPDSFDIHRSVEGGGQAAVFPAQPMVGDGGVQAKDAEGDAGFVFEKLKLLTLRSNFSPSVAPWI